MTSRCNLEKEGKNWRTSDLKTFYKAIVNQTVWYADVQTGGRGEPRNGPTQLLSDRAAEVIQ